MIRYALTCDKGHAFDGWFRSSEDYDKQRKRRLVLCPSCSSSKISKALMAPRVVPSDKAAGPRRRQARAAPPATAPAPEQSLVASPEQRELLKRMRELRDQMLSQSEYVGPRFAEEARKIHEEETPTRGIHGEASPSEVKSLLEDGIGVLPIPTLPDDSN